jgi:hypothetical protein
LLKSTWTMLWTSLSQGIVNKSACRGSNEVRFLTFHLFTWWRKQIHFSKRWV